MTVVVRPGVVMNGNCYAAAELLSQDITVLVTSGVRTTHAQARAMYPYVKNAVGVKDCTRMLSVDGTYGAHTSAYIASRLQYPVTREALERVLAKGIASGKITVSAHLSGRAIDLDLRSLVASGHLQKVLSRAKAAGLSAHTHGPGGVHNHVHVQWPENWTPRILDRDLAEPGRATARVPIISADTRQLDQRPTAKTTVRVRLASFVRTINLKREGRAAVTGMYDRRFRLFTVTKEESDG